MAYSANAPLLSLPVDIFDVLLDYIAEPAPSSDRLHSEPGYQFTDRRDTPLNKMSRLCKALYPLIATRLFRTARLKIRATSVGSPPVLRYTVYIQTGRLHVGKMSKYKWSTS